MKISKKRWFYAIAATSVLLILLFFIFRNSLLNYFLEKKIAQFEEKFHTKVVLKEADFKGLNGLLLTGIQVAPEERDTLLKVDSVFFNLRILPLILGKIRLSNLEISNSQIHLVRSSTRNNFSNFLERKKSEKLDSVVGKLNYGEIASNLINKVFDAIPAYVKFTRAKVEFITDSLNLEVSLPELLIHDELFFTHVNVLENGQRSSWVASGEINAADRKAALKIFPEAQSKLEIPVLQRRFGLTLDFDTIAMQIKGITYLNDALKINGTIAAVNFGMKHWRISPNKVLIKNQSIDYALSLGSNYFQMDSISKVSYNKVSYHPFLRFQVYPHKELYLSAKMDECDSKDFFESLPEGLFENIDGIKTTGKLFYKLHFFIDTRYPDQLEFSSYLGKKDFKVLGFGHTHLTKLNSEFQYTAYEKGRAVRTFMVGPSNPYYTPIEQISPLLKSSLLTSEDGNFYSHLGFNEDAFRKSIATNFKQKRFVRGGSTISMQLVKNVFLTRNKTVARKVEEALIVWLIENNRLTSKERMYEVYLNLIEWGPGVYGIGEASEFYFSKKPADLNLGESIFLAMIVPRPKGFKYNFDAGGKLKASAAGYYSIIANHLVKRGVISEEDKNKLLPQIELKGKAKSLVLVTDTLQMPELEVEDDD